MVRVRFRFRSGVLGLRVRARLEFGLGLVRLALKKCIAKIEIFLCLSRNTARASPIVSRCIVLLSAVQ